MILLQSIDTEDVNGLCEDAAIIFEGNFALFFEKLFESTDLDATLLIEIVRTERFTRW